MCTQCNENKTEIESLENSVMLKITAGLMETLDLAAKAVLADGGLMAEDWYPLVEKFAGVFAHELVDQVEYESVPGSDHLVALLCNLLDVANAWIRANNNL